jgi:hypothetical protein
VSERSAILPLLALWKRVRNSGPIDFGGHVFAMSEEGIRSGIPADVIGARAPMRQIVPGFHGQSCE